MSNRPIRSSGARWSASQTTSTPLVPPLFIPSYEQNSSIDDGPTFSPLIMRDDGPANTAHPLYIQKCGNFNGSVPSITRPDGYEPDFWHGRPLTFPRRPKGCILYHPLDNGGVSGPSSSLPFDQASFYTAIDGIAASVKALGVHLYVGPHPQHGSWLLWGMPMGGYEPAFWGDYTSRASLPTSFPYGELLVLVMTPNPTGFGASFAGNPDGPYNSGTQTLITVICGADDASGSTLAQSYYGFDGANFVEQPDLLVNDQTIAIEYITHFDRFEQRLHKYDDAAITKLYQDAVTPVATPPAGYPGDATDVWLAATAGIPEYTIGADISPLDPYDVMAATILASIQDFYS